MTWRTGAWALALALSLGLASCRRNADVTPGGLQDLPVVEVGPGAADNPTLVVMLSGDGGWADIDRKISAELAAKGFAVAGLNTLKYFWKSRSPEEASRDLERMLRHYLARWNKRRVIVIGYSLGADAIPVMANRLPPDLSERVGLIALIGAARTYELEFHLVEWIPWVTPVGLPTLPELRKLQGKKILCFHAREERESLCSDLPGELGTSILLPGNHHFDRHYAPIVNFIVAAYLSRE